MKSFISFLFLFSELYPYFIDASLPGVKGKVSVFGATGGLGQWCCKLLKDKGYAVTAITRDLKAAKNFQLLKECNFLEANARILNNDLIDSVRDSRIIIISVGTTG